MQLGYALKESKQTEEARAAFEEVIRITPDTPAGNEAERRIRELAEAS